jgi:membrane protease YdiL (CAAX protease family)
MIGATPAICEELLFRGYVQTRLTRTVGPAVGILISSVLFAAVHMDWVHIIAVFPLGLFLGFVSWRSGSLYPAMLGHFINNVISVIAVVYAPQGETDVFAVPIAIVSLSVIGMGIIGLIAVGVLTIARGRPPQQVA